MPAPVNDNFASATAITGASGSIAGTTVSSTNETGEPLSGYPGVWYKYTAVANSVVQFDIPTYSGTDFNVVMVAYPDAGFPSTDDRLAQMQPSDSFSGVTAKVNLLLTNGSSIYLKVGVAAPAQTFTLTWVTITPADIDSFVGAATLSPGTNVYNMSGATTEPGETLSSPNHHKTVWRKFTAAYSGTYVFETSGGDGNERGYIYRQDGVGLAGLTNMLGGGIFSNSPQNVTLASGIDYWVRVAWSFDTTISVIMTEPAPPPSPPANDNWANATLLTGSGGTFEFDTTGATSEGANDPLSEAALGYSDTTIWYKIAASSDTRLFNGATSAATVGTPAQNDTVLWVGYGSSLATLTELAHDDDSGPSVFSLIPQVTIPSGQDFYISLAHYGSAEGFATFTWSIAVAAICISAITDPGLAGTLTNTGTAMRETQSVYDGAGNPDVSILGDATPMFYVRGANLPSPGLYTATISYMRQSGGSGTNDWYIGIKRNGLTLGPVYRWTAPATLTSQSITKTNDAYQYYGPDTIPILAGDVLEICAVNTGGFVGTVWPVEITQICFTKVGEASSGRPAMYPLEGTVGYLGGTAIHTDLATKVPRGKEIAVLNNGDVYVFFTQSFGSSNAVSLVKYSGSSWSTVSDDVWGHGHYVASPSCYNASLVTDGTDLWMAWGETDGTLGSSGQPNWMWRCMKYTPATNTFTELGTGQKAFSWTAGWRGRSPMIGYQIDGGYDEKISLAISPGGVLWAAGKTAPIDPVYDVSLAGSAGNLDGGTDGFNSLTGSNPAQINGSGTASGTVAGESGSYATQTLPGPIDPSGIQGPMERAHFTIVTPPTGSDWVGIAWRISGQGSASWNGYRMLFKAGTTNNVIYQKVVSGTATTINTLSTVHNLAAGDQISVAGGYNYPNVKWRDAASTTDWTYLGGFTSDSTYQVGNAIYALIFNGTSGLINTLRAGNTKAEESPVVWRWTGSEWVNTNLPMSQPRRNFYGQSVGVVTNSHNESHVQLAFVNGSGPSENPSVFFCTEHDQQYGNILSISLYADEHEIMLHYYEWDGSAWGNYLEMGTYDIWGDAMYATANTSPNYSRNNGFPQGFSFLNVGGKPFIIMQVVVGISGVDLVGAATLTGGVWIGEAAGNPDDVERVYSKSPGAGPWVSDGMPAVVDSKGQVFAMNFVNQRNWVPNMIMRNAEGFDIGTGSQWAIGAYTENQRRYTDLDSEDDMAVGADDKVYIVCDIDPQTSSPGTYVYEYIPGDPWYPEGVYILVYTIVSMKY